ncbi:DUF2917 domain-containing protein [Bordetella genomosp. 13]|nr:DUF2917 domain-containing protein [Bordetella genomosp. 13]
MTAGTISFICMKGMSFSLPPGAAVKLRRAVGVRILCRTGTLWVSEYRRAEDLVLQAGQCAQVGSDSAIVLSGLPSAEVEIQQPESRP